MSKICWTRKNLASAMNPNAEAVPDEIFRAVHTEFNLLLYKPIRSEKGKKVDNAQQMTPREFLNLFLDKDKPHVQVAVLGSSGSGKSHLIQWLRLNIPSSPKLRVHTIPKARTSLRSIIEDIICELPPHKRELYKNRLEATAHQTADQEQQKNFLLNNLASSIQMDRPEDTGDGLESMLIQNLPSLFLDPHLRPSFFLKKGKVIEQLAGHIFAAPGTYVSTDSRKAFSEADLPKYANHFPKAAKETRDALDLLTISESIPKALKIINRNVNRAISFCLGFTGDSLIELMYDIRKDMVSRGEELILLIEDFARLQGVDYALLQALTTPETQAGVELSRLRWAMAVTKGYYDPLPDTVHTRMEFIVDMDLPGADNRSFIGREGLSAFSARYLNAARVGRSELKSWSDTVVQNNADPDSVPNACDGCDSRDSCHSAFGEVNGTGLYPFTKTALWNMALRADNSLEEKFNPRSVIKEVLKSVLENYDSQLGQGYFPPRQLLNDFQGVQRLSAATESKLRDYDKTNFDRRITLLELWDGSGGIVNFNEGIHEWFNLPALEIEDKHLETPSEDSPPPPPPVEDERLKIIEEWARGGKLEEKTAQNLRDWIYPLIDGTIEWNRHGLHKSTFFRKKGLMRLPAIYFVEQTTDAPNDPLRIRLPLHPEDEEEFNRVSIALQGLVHFHSKGHWDFDGGQEALAHLLDLVQEWSDHLLEVILDLYKFGEAWNPPRAAMELLAIGGVLSGKSGRDGVMEGFKGALTPWPEEGPILNGTLKDIRKQIFDNRDRLISIFRTWRTGTKGGEMGRMINPTDLEPAVMAILKGNMPSQTPPSPDRMTEDYRKLIEIYTKVSSELAGAVEEEVQHRLEWLDEITAQLGELQDGERLVEEMTKLREKLVNCGLAIPKGLMNDFNLALSNFQPAVFRKTRKGYKPLRTADSNERFRMLSTGSTRAVLEFRQLVSRTEALLDSAERGVESKHAELGGTSGEVAKNLDEIGNALAQLEMLFNEVERFNAH